jgi:hypothetical protein
VRRIEPPAVESSLKHAASIFETPGAYALIAPGALGEKRNRIEDDEAL